MKKKIVLLIWIIGLTACVPRDTKDKTGFSFAFLTDIHMNFNETPESFDGFSMAVEHAKSQGAAFILTGGDNVDIDVLEDDSVRSRLLYRKFSEAIDTSDIRIHPCIGNHDRFLGGDSCGAAYDEGMFEQTFGYAYNSFDHRGWHFIALNTTKRAKTKYVVDEEQLAWLNDDLDGLSSSTPIVLIMHVPFLSLYYPATEGYYSDYNTCSNFRQVWDLFEGYNLKLVLQGHMHLYEEIRIRGVQFITGGAVSASWWYGPYYSTEEGYLLVTVDGDEFSWEYQDYGWESQSTRNE